MVAPAVVAPFLGAPLGSSHAGSLDVLPVVPPPLLVTPPVLGVPPVLVPPDAAMPLDDDDDDDPLVAEIAAVALEAVAAVVPDIID